MISYNILLITSAEEANGACREGKLRRAGQSRRRHLLQTRRAGGGRLGGWEAWSQGARENESLNSGGRWRNVTLLAPSSKRPRSDPFLPSVPISWHKQKACTTPARESCVRGTESKHSTGCLASPPARATEPSSIMLMLMLILIAFALLLGLEQHERSVYYGDRKGTYMCT